MGENLIIIRTAWKKGGVAGERESDKIPPSGRKSLSAKLFKIWS